MKSLKSAGLGWENKLTQRRGKSMINIRIPSKYKARCYKCDIDIVCELCDIERAEEKFDILEWGVSKGKAIREIEFIKCPICNRKIYITTGDVIEYTDITPEEYNTIKGSVRPSLLQSGE